MLQILIWLLCVGLFVGAWGITLVVSSREYSSVEAKEKATKDVQGFLLLVGIAAFGFAGWAYMQGTELASAVSDIPRF